MNQCCKDIGNSTVKETRQAEGGSFIKRRRECCSCYETFNTFECTITDLQALIASVVSECGPKMAKALQEQTTKSIAYHIKAMYRSSVDDRQPDGES